MAVVSDFDARGFGRAFLQDILEWVTENFEPGDVFSGEILREYIADNFSPEEIFPMDELEEAVGDQT